MKTETYKKRLDIHSGNCLNNLKYIQSSGDIETKAKCWTLVYEFCMNNGMHKMNLDPSKSGIEKVISFLERNLKK